MSLNEDMKWVERYEPALKENLQEMYKLIEGMAPAYDCNPWPYGYENALLGWIKSGDFSAVYKYIRPGDRSVINQFTFDRMKFLHEKLEGWIFREEFIKNATFFVKTEEIDQWQKDTSPTSRIPWEKTKWGMLLKIQKRTK